MQKIQKNKFLIVFLIFFILLVNICSSVKAESKDVVYFHDPHIDKDITFYLPTGYGTIYNHYLILSLKTSSFYNDYVFICSTVPFYRNGISSDFLSFSTYNKNDIYYYKSFEAKEGRETGIVDISNYVINEFESTYNGGFGSFPVMVYSNFTIYSDLDNTEEVFHPAPQERVEPMKTQQVEEIPHLIIQITLIVLPIFLTIFGMLLVLYLIRSKNLLNL